MGDYILKVCPSIQTSVVLGSIHADHFFEPLNECKMVQMKVDFLQQFAQITLSYISNLFHISLFYLNILSENKSTK